MNRRINRIYEETMSKNLLWFYLSFTCVKRCTTYICTWFTCLTHTDKMVLSTGLEHSDNTTTLEKGSSTQEGYGWFQPPHKVWNWRKFWKDQSWMNYLKYLCMLRTFESLKFLIFPCTIFCHIFLNIGTTLWAKI